MRDLLRTLPSLAGPLPAFDPSAAPPDPADLFRSWLTEAISTGVPEPHATVLSTVDPLGRPSGRVLILKDLVDGLWCFASGSGSRKGKELANNPFAALTFYWPLMGRQIRVRGPVETSDGSTDFLARSPEARATALLGNQSEPLGSQEKLSSAVSASLQRVLASPGLISPEWTVYGVRADEVEFWQGESERRHIRLRYQAVVGGGWERDLLWP
jgi:pyridoxamine 5'-phosphate oxidase